MTLRSRLFQNPLSASALAGFLLLPLPDIRATGAETICLQGLDLPEEIADWSLTSIQNHLIKIGARVVRHARKITFQLAEVAVSGALFGQIITAIRNIMPPPRPACQGLHDGQINKIRTKAASQLRLGTAQMAQNPQKA